MIQKKYFNPDITKIAVTINGSPNQLYNDGLKAEDFWKETMMKIIFEDFAGELTPEEYKALIARLKNKSTRTLSSLCGTLLGSNQVGDQLNVPRQGVGHFVRGRGGRASFKI